MNNLRELNIYIADFRKYIETKDENEILDSALNRFNGGICLEDDCCSAIASKADVGSSKINTFASSLKIALANNNFCFSPRSI